MKKSESIVVSIIAFTFLLLTVAVNAEVGKPGIKPSSTRVPPTNHKTAVKKPALKPGTVRKLLRPDLTVSLAKPQAGRGLRIFTSNRGKANAGAFIIKVSCYYWPGTDFKLKVSCKIPNIPVKSLAKGKTDTRQIPLSYFKKGQNHSVMVTVDVAKQVWESNESNNSKSMSFLLQ
jgi:hypothetical protein